MKEGHIGEESVMFKNYNLSEKLKIVKRIVNNALASAE
jgi:hypothetical protein